MGAKQSAEMRKAMKLVLERGMTQAGAARAAGLTKGAISKSQWYRDFKAKTAKKHK